MKPYCIGSLLLMVAVCTLGGSGREQTSAAQGPAANGQPAAGAEGGRGVVRSQPNRVDFDDHPGWVQMFDGQSLNGWETAIRTFGK
jgi:hypothetical protein